MNTKNHSIEHVLKIKKLKHVFFITSPIVEIVAFQVLHKFNIPLDRVILVSLRGYAPKLINAELVVSRKSYLSRILLRFLNFSYEGYRVKRKLIKQADKYILYAPWDTDQAIEVMSSNLCAGHVYLEEGQMTYQYNKPYNVDLSRKGKYQRISKWKKGLKKLSYRDDVPVFNEFYNEAALAYVGISDKVYPAIDRSKVVVINDMSKIKEVYKFKIKDKRSIGVMCTPRRLVNIGVIESVNRLMACLPENSCIKLHPDFYNIKKTVLEVDEHIKNSGRKIELCDEDVVIELEMLCSNKKLYGAVTSLSKYAEIFGSEYEKVDLY